MGTQKYTNLNAFGECVSVVLFQRWCRKIGTQREDIKSTQANPRREGKGGRAEEGEGQGIQVPSRGTTQGDGERMGFRRSAIRKKRKKKRKSNECV